MKETGVIRRFDELGRIVIPKEIRKRMKLSSGDMVDIFVENERIILEKYHPLNQNTTPFKALLESISKESNVNFILFDKDKIIYSTLDEYESGDEVSLIFFNRIHSILGQEISSKLKMEIVEGIPIEKEIYIEKIVVDFEDYGYIAIIDDMVFKKHKDIIKLIKNYFEIFLKN